jgi:hypothetical protein
MAVVICVVHKGVPMFRVQLLLAVVFRCQPSLDGNISIALLLSTG